MRTMMTRKSYHRTMRDLDDNTLWNQYGEAMDLLRVRLGLKEDTGINPARHMWRGHDHALVVYIHSTVQERVRRWNNRYDRKAEGSVDPWKEMDELFRALGKLPPFDVPPWWGDLDIYRSHRAALLRKDPEWYDGIWSDAQSNLAALWPVIAEDDHREYVLYITPAEMSRVEKGDRVLPSGVEKRELVTSI